MEHKETAEIVVSTKLAKLETGIVRCYSNHNKTMSELASILTVIDDDKLYTERGAKSTAEYAYNRYGISKSSVSEAISVMHAYGERKGDVYKIRDDMSMYNYTQLKLIRRLPDDYALPSPEMSTRELESVIKSLKNNVSAATENEVEPEDRHATNLVDTKQDEVEPEDRHATNLVDTKQDDDTVVETYKLGTPVCDIVTGYDKDLAAVLSRYCDCDIAMVTDVAIQIVIDSRKNP